MACHAATERGGGSKMILRLAPVSLIFFWGGEDGRKNKFCLAVYSKKRTSVDEMRGGKDAGDFFLRER